MTRNRTKLLATGTYIPKRVYTNFDLKEFVETTDEWITERTGIKERHISDPNEGEFPSDMAKMATEKALQAAGLKPNDIDMIIFSTVSPDYKLPNSASLLQTKLGMTNQCTCFDIAAACSGFVYGTNMADSFIKSGLAKNVLVVGSEMLSREVDWQDRRTCVLFGDGCGVGIYGPSPDNEESEILSTVMGADGTGKEFFQQLIGGSVTPITADHILNREHFMQMQGREMFKVATRTLAGNARKALEQANVSLDELDWVVPHQANARIIETTAKLLGIPMDKVLMNIHKYGNTSAATIPIAFHEAVEDGRIKRGDLVLFDAFGAGLTYGATLLRY